MRIEFVFLAAVLLCSCCGTAPAGSAVAVGQNRDLHFVYSYGFPEEIAQRRAVEICRKRGGINPILIQSTNTVGFGAAAIWRHGQDWILGVALGCGSPQEAQKRAILDCKRKGGVAPEVRWGWKG